MKYRVKAQVDMGRLRHNYKYIKSIVGENCRVMAVVKADGYGHGAAKVSRQLLRLGCTDFAVACLSEAQKLKEKEVTGNILILGTTDPELIPDVIAGGFIQTVDSFEYAKQISQYGKLRVHIKIDTGMSRLGIYCHTEKDIPAAVSKIRSIVSLENIIIDGIFTHFADSDSPDRSFTDRQFKIFTALLSELSQRGIKVGVRHCCNSAATLRFPEMHLDMVRAGIILYGLSPARTLQCEGIKPLMKLTARICAIHKLMPGDSVSYGCAYKAERDTTVAVISIGYADGFSRVYSEKPIIKIKGKRLPTLGKICMDMCIVDIGEDSDCKVGDEAVIFETAEDINNLADIMGTINYEVLCSLKHRVLLQYINQQK